MSGVRAARALLALDASLAECVELLTARVRPSSLEWRPAVLALVRERVMGTWTLTLAAEAAGATEQQVVAALLYLEPLRIGSNCVCRGEAEMLFAERG